MKATEYIELFATERFENGIYYIFNVDDANKYSSFKEAISQSNICMEFISPTKDISPDRPDSPDIGICILTNVNQGRVPKERLVDVTDIIVRGLNNIIHKQIHPTSQANAYIREYATLGVGFSNTAYFLAKNECRYGDQKGLDLINSWTEHFQYGLIKASMEVAKYKGPAPKFNETIYTDGKMPLDRYCENVDELVQPSAGGVDWEWLKAQVKIHKMANCSLSMIPPSETSSISGGQTNSIDPIKRLLTIKGSKTNQIKQLAPEAMALAQQYDYCFDHEITAKYLKNAAVICKWIDMGASINTFYNPELYPKGKVPIKLLIEDMFIAKHFGIPTFYYNNVYVEDNDITQESCVGGGCSV